MLISAIFHTDDRGVWTYVSMNDDYYRRRIGPVNILTFVSGRALVDYIIDGFSRHWKGERRVPMGAADDSSGNGLVLLSSSFHRRGWALEASS